MSSSASAAAASEAAHEQAAEPAAKPQDFSCSICFELLLDPVVGACGHDFCQRCLRQWIRHRQQNTFPLPASATCPVCRKAFATSTAAVDQLGVCIRLRDTIALLFPEQLAARRAEVEQEEARRAAAAAAQAASIRAYRLSMPAAAGPTLAAVAVAAGTTAQLEAALLFEAMWDDAQDEEEEEGDEDADMELYDWVVGSPLPPGLPSSDQPPALNAMAAVMDDLNWLCRRWYPHLDGLGPSDALRNLQTQFGLRDGDVLAGRGTANAVQVSIVLRKAREAQASGRHLADVLRTANLVGVAPPAALAAAAPAPTAAPAAAPALNAAARPPPASSGFSNPGAAAWPVQLPPSSSLGFGLAAQPLGYSGSSFAAPAAAVGPAGSTSSFGFGMPPPAQYSVPGQFPAAPGGFGPGHPPAQHTFAQAAAALSGFGPGHPPAHYTLPAGLIPGAFGIFGPGHHPAQYSVPAGQVPGALGSFGPGHPPAQSSSDAGFGPGQPAVPGGQVPGMAYGSSSQPPPAVPAPQSVVVGAPGMAHAAGQQQRGNALSVQAPLAEVSPAFLGNQQSQVGLQQQQDALAQQQRQVGLPRQLDAPLSDNQRLLQDMIQQQRARLLGQEQERLAQEQHPGSMLPPWAAAFFASVGSAGVQGSGHQQQGSAAQVGGAAAAAAAAAGGGGGGPGPQPGDTPVFTIGWYDRDSAPGGINSSSRGGRRANIRSQR